MLWLWYELSGSSEALILGHKWSGGSRREEALRAFIADRTALLTKLCTDHLMWLQSLERCGRDASLAATWIDGEGQDHVVAINRAFLQAHRHIIRPVMADLYD
jgi:hypothetical protein